MAKFLKVQLNYSAIAREKRQKDTLRGLGLRHRDQIRILKDSPAVRGMIQKVIHLISFEETQDATTSKKEKRVTYQLGALRAPAKPKAKEKKPAKSSAKAAEGPEKKAKAPKKTAKKPVKKGAKTAKAAKKP